MFLCDVNKKGKISQDNKHKVLGSSDAAFLFGENKAA